MKDRRLCWTIAQPSTRWPFDRNAKGVLNRVKGTAIQETKPWKLTNSRAQVEGNIIKKIKSSTEESAESKRGYRRTRSGRQLVTVDPVAKREYGKTKYEK